MGFWAWFFARHTPLELPRTGEYDFEIVGESKYQAALEALAGGRTADGHRQIPVIATLIHEDSNPIDAEAIRVEIQGRRVGYLTRAAARQYRRWLVASGAAGRTTRCAAVIVGGWDRGPGRQGFFGLKLDLPSIYVPLARME